MKKNFIVSCILTGMDILVFCLCVDKGLQPVSIVGACYIALRCFSRDAQDAIKQNDEFFASVLDKIAALKDKIHRKEDNELIEIEDE